MTIIYPGSVPPLRPWVSHTSAISCLKPGDFLIRAWRPCYGTSIVHKAKSLTDWILYHVGRMDLADLEWWGYIYSSRPDYMGEDLLRYTSGLTIQRHVPTSYSSELCQSFGPPLDLDIPEKGIVRIAA